VRIFTHGLRLGLALSAMLGLAALTAQALGTRPTLEVRQGSYFRWASPPGWQVNETPNGVDIVAPDGLTGVSSVVAMGFPGAATPSDIILSVVQAVPGLSNVRTLARRGLPEQPAGPLRTPWQIAELEFSYVYNGIALRSTWMCGISSIPGFSFDAFLLGYQAPAANFDEDRLWLWRVANSIAITNIAGVAGNNQLIQPRNNPLDNSALLESWRQKGLSEDRIAKARREGTMGYERLKDDQTGQIYELPLEAYDGTVGGYRNPRRPHELLKKTEPGE
jgi:hypothetical protein